MVPYPVVVSLRARESGPRYRRLRPEPPLLEKKRPADPARLPALGLLRMIPRTLRGAPRGAIGRRRRLDVLGNEVHHETGHPSRLQRNQGHLKLWQHVQHPFHARPRPARGRLLRLSSLLHRQAKAGRHRRPRRQIPSAVRPQQIIIRPWRTTGQGRRLVAPLPVPAASRKQKKSSPSAHPPSARPSASPITRTPERASPMSTTAIPSISAITDVCASSAWTRRSSAATAHLMSHSPPRRATP